MNKKIIIAGTVFTAAVVTPIALTISMAHNSYHENKYKVTIALSAPVKTLNIFKASDLSEFEQIGGMFTSSLLRNRPSGEKNGGLETALSIPKLQLGFSDLTEDQVDQALAGKYEIVKDSDFKSSNQQFAFAGYTTDLANKVQFFGTPQSTIGVAFQLREDIRFWNGDRVTAEDFINTIKIALDIKNAVPWAWSLVNVAGIKNAKKIIDAQNKDGLTFDQAIAKYPLGIIPSNEIDEATLATSAEGKEFFKNEYAQGNKRHDRFIILTEGAQAQQTFGQFCLGGAFAPTSIRHFNKVGINNWGTTVDNIMGSGPYKLTYFDLDYKIVSDKWDGYWDKDRVISPQIEMRVLPDPSTQIKLFKDGKLGKVSFSADLMPQFFGDAQLKRYIKTTNWAEKLSYVRFNTKPGKTNGNWLLNSDLRNAIQYSINRSDYLRAIGADNSLPPESFSTQAQLSDASGFGVITHAINFKNDFNFINPGTFIKESTTGAIDEWNNLYNLPGDKAGTAHPLYTRDETQLTARTLTLNDKDDKVMNLQLAKNYFAKFKNDNPSFNGAEFKFLVPSTNKEQLVTLKQSIENNLPGIKIKLIPKLDSVYNQVAAGFDWDLAVESWMMDYQDPWTYYHKLLDKINQVENSDAIISSGQQYNFGGDGLSLVDYIAQRISQPDGEKYFAEHLFNKPNPTPDELKEINYILAQILRMESVVGSANPANGKWEDVDGTEITKYTGKIYDQAPSEANGFRGYQGTFDKFASVFPNASSWGTKLKEFITTYSNDEDQWNDKTFRFEIMYPTIEKLIRESAIGTPISRVQNSFIASRLIGEVNFAYEIIYLGYLYQADNIPKVKIPLPGTEVMTS